MRIAFMTIASLALAWLAFYELGFAYPAAWWLYLSVALMFAAALIRHLPVRQQLGRLGVLIAIIVFILQLYFVDWTTRKPFLRDLDRIQVGMTESEVRHIMEGYLEGTGWPALPGSNPTNAPGTLNIVGSGSQYSTATSPTGQLTIRDSLVFRHSNDGAFNSDWGIISLSSGKVISVEFHPD
ncbi:MAG: hypothetical protein K0Q55_1055 [Verrucomicrobia bacterium]|jgi:hypothetical protein|nr:hypothetical protein [Verrucomicrobiota bacterium]